jgi:hypothetical protein
VVATAMGMGVPGSGVAEAGVRAHLITPSVSVAITPASPSQYGTSVSIAVKVGGSGGKATGTVQFTVNGNVIPGCGAIRIFSALGKGTCTTTSLPIGSDTIVVNYSGDSTYSAASSEPVPYVVSVATPSIQFTATPSTSAPAGSVVTLNATLSGGGGTPTGTVEFQSDGADINGCSAQAIDSSGSAQCATTTLGLGTDSLRAVYSGSSAYQSVSANLSYTITKITPTVQLTASPTTNDPAGGSVVLTATVSGSGSTPTGTVDFESNGTSILTCSAVSIVSGTAQCTTTSLATGTDDLLAVYSGDATYSPGSGGLTYAVGESTPTVYLGVAPGTSSGQYVLTAVVAGPAGVPAGTVQFQQGTNTITGCGSVTLSAGSATCTTSSLSSGTNTLTASYSGGGPYTPAQTSITFDVVLAVSQVHLTTVPQAGDTVGNAVTLSASVTSAAGTPTGTVDFQSNGADISGCSAVSVDSTGNARCTTSALAVGTDDLGAIYSGDSNNNPNSDSIAYAVGQAAPVVTLAAAPGTSSGQYVLTATVNGAAGTPTGIVDFQAAGVDIAGCAGVSLDGGGMATCTTSSLAPGANQLLAAYSGDTNYLARQTSISYDTALATPSVVVTASPTSGASAGSLVTLRAAVTGGSVVPTGTVEFQSNSVAVPGCSAVVLDTTGTGTCATSTLAAGSDDVVALYSGDSRFNAASGDLAYSVAKPTPALYLSVAPGASTGQYVLTAVAVGGAGIPTGTVEFEQSGFVISGCSASSVDSAAAATCTTNLSPGSTTLTAIYSGDQTYTSSNTTIPFDTGLGTPQVQLTAAPATGDTFGQAVTLTTTVVPPVGSAAGTPTGTVEFQSNGTDISGCSAVTVTTGATAACTTSELGVGTDALEALYSGTSSQYNPASGALAYGVGLARPHVALAATRFGTDVVGDSVTLTATVTGVGTVPSGLVRFEVGTTGITGCLAVRLTTAGVATCKTKSLPAGTDSLTAAYQGDNLYQSRNGTLRYVVAKAVPKLQFVSLPGKQGVAGAFVILKVKLTGQAARPTGRVVFRVGKARVPGCRRVRVRRGVAKCRTEGLGLGTNRVVARYSGDGDYLARSALHRFTVIDGGYWIASRPGATRAYGPVATKGGAGIGCTTVAIVSAPDTDGFWLVCSNGRVTSRGKAAHLTGVAASHVIAATATPDGKGLWLLTSSGGIRRVGDAKALKLIQRGSRAPVSGIASTLDGKGLWVVHTDGAVTRYGDAEPLGFTGSQRLNGVICGIVTSPHGQGFGLVAKDGGVFSFGTFAFYGSLASKHLASPIVSMALSPLGSGYLLVARDGVVYPFGKAKVQPARSGSLSGPVVGIAIQD